MKNFILGLAIYIPVAIVGVEFLDMVKSPDYLQYAFTFSLGLFCGLKKWTN